MARVAGHGRARGAGQGSGWAGAVGWPAGRYRGPVGALPAGRRGRGRRRCCWGVFRSPSGGGAAELTVRSYGMDLLRWFRFLWASGVAWDRAGRSEARDFCRWLQLAGKPVRPHWRERSRPEMGAAVPVAGEVYAPSCGRIARRCCAAFMTSTWRRAPARWSTRSRWTGPGGGGRAHAHRNPMEPYHLERSGMYRPAVPSRIPRSVPDEDFNEIFAALHSHRDGPWWRRRACTSAPGTWSVVGCQVGAARVTAIRYADSDDRAVGYGNS